MNPARRTTLVFTLVLSTLGLTVRADPPRPSGSADQSSPALRASPDPLRATSRRALPDLDVVGGKRLVRGSDSVFDARVFLAHDWLRREALDVPVSARLLKPRGAPGGSSAWAGDEVEPDIVLDVARVGSQVTISVPRHAPLGPQTLVLEAPTPFGPATATLKVDIVDTTRVLLRTDSAIVAPGGRLAWRVWLLDVHTRRPLADESLVVTLWDRANTPRGRVVVKTDRFGRASGFMPIPEHNARGRHRLEVRGTQRSDVVASEDIEIRPFEPQAFFVSVTEHSSPELRVADFEVAARHADGLPMREAQVVVRDEHKEVVASGRTDDDGRFRLESPVPALTAEVLDARGERVVASYQRRAASPLSIDLITGGVTAVAGEHLLFTVATRHGVEPVATPVSLELRLDGDLVATRDVQTDAVGLAQTSFLLAPRARTRTERRTKLTLSTSERDGDLTALRSALDTLDVVRCFERGSLLIELDVVSHAKGAPLWRVSSLHKPFPERPDFVAVLNKDQAACLDLLAKLPPVGDLSSARAEISIFEVTTVGYDGDVKVEITARTPDGAATSRALTTQSPSGAGPLDIAPILLSPGEDVVISKASSSATRSERADENIVLLLDDGVVVGTAPLEEVTRLRVPAEATGLLTLELVTLERLEHGRSNAAVAQVYSRPRSLAVALAVAERARPGSTLPLSVAVTDDGRPVQAALTASVLDERLLALSPEVANKPPLAAWLAREATAQLGPSDVADRFAELIRQPTLSSIEQSLLRALFMSVPSPRPVALAVLPSPARVAAERRWLQEHRTELVALAVRTVDLKLGTSVEVPFSTLDKGLDPWGRARTWSAVRGLVPTFEAAVFGDQVTRARAELILPRLRHKRSLVTVPRHLAQDAWGQAFVVRSFETDLLLVSAGPDGVLDTADDLTFSRESFRFVSGHSLGLVGYGAGGGGSASFRSAAVHVASFEQVQAVRERFDTNVLWASTQTGTDGRHTFEVPLSDSVTTWRVDVEAMTDDGRFGHARTQVVASLPLSVDLRLPDALVVGDAFEASALVVNASPTERDLALSATVDGLTVGDLTPLGRVGPNTSRPVAIPLRATAAGRGKVTLTLTDVGTGTVVDSMIKYLDVQDIGAEVRRVARARVSDHATLPAEVPAGARNVTAIVTAHRGAPDLALASLEALLKTPTGCFEQTTAKNWPNLLVLRLVPADSAVAAKAKDLARAGYERLKTFEIGSRGFALYPGSDPSTILTAIGLVQLVDTARVMEIENAWVQRIARALVNRQDESGHFRIDQGWYGSADKGVVTAYATWAIAEALRFDAEQRKVQDQIPLLSAFDVKTLTKARDRGLRALASHAEGRFARYVDVLAHLAGKAPNRSASAHAAGLRQDEPPATLYASGRSAVTELDGLELLAKIRTGQDGQRHVDALMAARSPGGGWATTQATVHALRALAELDTGAPRGALRLQAGAHALEPLSLEGAELPTRALDLQGVSALDVTVDAPVLVELDLSWREPDAPRRVSQGLNVHVDTPSRAVPVGQRETLTVGVHNPGAEAVTLPTAVVDIPPGFALDEAALRQAVGGRLKNVEVFGRRVELYFDVLPPGQAALVPLVVTATTAADVVMRPATAFAYYDPEIFGRSDQPRLVAVR